MWKPGFGKKCGNLEIGKKNVETLIWSKFVNLEPVERSERLLLNQLQLVPSQVELLQACAEIQKSFSVNADNPILRKPQHLGRGSLIHCCTIFLRFPVF